MTKCTICMQQLPTSARSNPVNSGEFRSKPMAVFDIDETILDVSQRFRDALRAGLTNKDGTPKKKKLTETTNKATSRRNEFLYKPTNLQKDSVIPGALALIESLVLKGYLIGYITARPFKYHPETVSQLEDKGFPIFRNDRGELLVRSKGKKGVKHGTYKAEVLTQWSQSYDVRMFFDDDTDTLETVASDNNLDIPGIYSSIKEYKQYQSRSNPAEYIVREGSEEDEESDDPSGYGFYGFTGDVDSEDANRRNPPVKPRRKKMKNGKYRKEPAKKYIDRFMADPKMGQEFPDRGQRYAVALNYVKRYYGKRGLDSVGARQNPAPNCGCGQSPCVTYGTRSNPEEYSEDYMVPRDIHRLGKAADRLEETYEDGLDTPEWWKSKLSVTAKDADTIADSLDYVKDNPRKNPSHSKKVEKGKKLYKHMNGKEPEKIEQKKVDVGDVWYQVGEGGCWQIGYMSGKETGKTDQKYTHTFNEETKDGNFPKLYATMPESGKPLLIIQGGTWKIRTDDQGVAWIYD